jgi:hypothetical protein
LLGIHPYEYDPTGFTSSHHGFTPEGPISASRRSAPTTETLWLAKVEDIGHPERYQQVVDDVTSWAVTPDMKKWVYLKVWRHGTDSATLTVADFPGAGNATPVSDAVTDYELLTDPSGSFHGISVLQQGVLHVLRDPARPSTDPGNFPALATGLVERPTFSRDRRDILYFSEPPGGSSSNRATAIARLDGSAGCTFPSSSTATRLSPEAFTPTGRRVFWADNFDVSRQTRNVWMGDPASCGTSTKVADGVSTLSIEGEEGIVFATPDARDLSVAYRGFVGGNRARRERSGADRQPSDRV